jgi:hypothetical protein
MRPALSALFQELPPVVYIQFRIPNTLHYAKIDFNLISVSLSLSVHHPISLYQSYLAIQIAPEECS